MGHKALTSQSTRSGNARERPSEAASRALGAFLTASSCSVPANFWAWKKCSEVGHSTPICVWCGGAWSVCVACACDVCVVVVTGTFQVNRIFGEIGKFIIWVGRSVKVNNIGAGFRSHHSGEVKQV